MASDLTQYFLESFGQLPRVRASAPGRIEFIGNHTDYNGGLVLGAAIDRGVTVAVAPREDTRLRLRSVMETAEVSLELEEVAPRREESAWANYPLGVLQALRGEGLVARHGFDLAVSSNLPAGAGLSSSAALELATALALSRLFGLELSRENLALACRRAENEFVGMPCGILDQGVSAFGRPDHLVQIDCQRLSFETVPLPAGTHFWIFNTNQKHSLINSLYATRHEECAQAFRRLQAFHPQAVCLAELRPDQVRARAEALPEPLLARARHVVEENQRVRETVQALRCGDLRTVGRLLHESHESSRTLFQNSTPELDTFVQLLRYRPHVVGARLTGGGFGGAVMAMTDEEFAESDAAVVSAEFAARFDSCCPAIFHTRTGEGARLLPGETRL